MLKDHDITLYANLDSEQVLNLMLVSIASKDLSLVEIMMRENQQVYKSIASSDQLNSTPKPCNNFNKWLYYWIKQEELSIKKLEAILSFFQKKEERYIYDDMEE